MVAAVCVKMNDMTIVNVIKSSFFHILYAIRRLNMNCCFIKTLRNLKCQRRQFHSISKIFARFFLITYNSWETNNFRFAHQDDMN